MTNKFNSLGKQGFLLFISLFFIFVLAGSSLQNNYVQSANAQEDPEEPAEPECKDKLTVRLVVRDQDNHYIPDIDYSINVQTEDADGDPRPGTQVANGTTNIYTGIGTSQFVPSEPVYLIKVWDKNSKVAEFYFYDAIVVADYGCGGVADKEVQVGSLHIVLRDSQNNLRANSAFKLYTQRYDVDNNPLKNSLVASYTTGPTGDVTTYVTDTEHSVDGVFEGNYVLETKGLSKGIDYKYNIKAKKQDTVEVAYKFSDIAFTVIDSEEVPFPSNSEVRIYKQAIDLDGEKIFGDFVDAIETNDKGVAIFEYPAGTYAASLVGGDGQLYKFYDLNMVEQKRTEIILQTTEDYVSGEGQCSERSFLNVTPRSANGDIVPGLKVALYKQEIDANGVPIATSKIVSNDVQATGVASMSFKPDPRETYVLKIYDQSDDTGEFWFFDDIQFFCNQDKEISKTLSSIKVIIRDIDGNLLPNQKFSIYAQKYDVDDNPMKEKSSLVKTTNTLGEGYARIYVASDHPYNPLKKGIYAFYVKIGKEEFLEYDIEVEAGKETVFEYRLPVASDPDEPDEPGYKPEVRTGSLFNRLKGYILLQVEDHGEAWYVDHISQKRYYMKDGPTAYEMMRRFGLGITTANLEKIPVGIDDRFEDIDTDGDGLADKMEEALGSDIYDTDSDDDGYSDGDEVKGGYSPISSSPTKLRTDGNLTNQLLGKILLQVESRGEAWYLNPQDGKRYYMKDGPAAYQIMRFLSLGITNLDLQQISTGSL